MFGYFSVISTLILIFFVIASYMNKESIKNSESEFSEKHQRSVVVFRIVLTLLILNLLYIARVRIDVGRAGGCYTFCQLNLKNIGCALEMYSQENNNEFPYSLDALTPKYLETIPTCPTTGKDTYSSSYVTSVYNDAYTFYCRGLNHKYVGVPENYPQYNSITGLQIDLNI